MRGPDKPSPRSSDDADALTVSQLSSRIERAIVAGLPAQVCVQGEVSGVRVRTHTYFDLKDEHAVLACVMFRSKVSRSRHTITDGQHVVVRGQATYYAKQSRVSLVVDSIDPIGTGARDMQLRALCDELRSLGWFDENRKRPLPLFPRNIAVVTSRSAAALADVRATLARRCPSIGILLFDTPVQGDSATTTLVRQIRCASLRANDLQIDAILVTRGGGSAEDLWCFHDREVARAIIEASVPVVAAIGHETDVTVAELVSDRRAATPTQAAMVVSPDRAAMLDQIGFLSRRLDAQAHRHGEFYETGVAQLDALLTASVRNRIEHEARRCAWCESRLYKAHTRLSPESLGERLGRLHSRMESLVSRHLARRGNRVCELERSLAMRTLSTLSGARQTVDSVEQRLTRSSVSGLLARGFSVMVNQHGRIVRRSDEVATGDRVVSRLGVGEISSTVDGVS